MGEGERRRGRQLPWSGGSDEELRAVGILSGVCHGEESFLAVLELEVLIGEFVAINCRHTISTVLTISPPSIDKMLHTRLSTGPISPCEVAPLGHEALDNTVEARVLVTEALLSSSQSPEVLDGLGNSAAVQPHHDTAHGFVAMADIEIDFVSNLGAFGCFGGLGEEDECDSENQ